MIQISLEKLSALMAVGGENLADYPDLAAQVMVLNEKMAAAPGFTAEVLKDLIVALTTESPSGE